jgi:large subunit ribosomal protein LP0
MAGAEGSQAARKQAYFTKIVKLLDENPRILIVGADNVGSNQMQKIRIALRGKGVVLMGKNTMIRKALRGHAENNKGLEALLPYVKGNIGFVFTKETPGSLKKIITDNKVAAPAKPGSVAPCDVTVPAGPTGMEPTMTSFLQALGIASKIAKGQVEILNDVLLVKTGQKVGSSEASLLAKLDIKPFSYGLVIQGVYENGSVWEPSLLDMGEKEVLDKFAQGVRNVAAISLAAGYPTLASVPHSLTRGYKNVLSIGLATSYSFPKVEELKKILANPGAFSAPPPAAAAADSGAKGGGKKEEKKPEPKKEEPEEEEDMGLGLFD